MLVRTFKVHVFAKLNHYLFFFHVFKQTEPKVASGRGSSHFQGKIVKYRGEPLKISESRSD